MARGGMESERMSTQQFGSVAVRSPDTEQIWNAGLCPEEWVCISHDALELTPGGVPILPGHLISRTCFKFQIPVLQKCHAGDRWGLTCVPLTIACSISSGSLSSGTITASSWILPLFTGCRAHVLRSVLQILLLRHHSEGGPVLKTTFFFPSCGY